MPPPWEFIAQLEEEDAITYGGYFIYRDQSGLDSAVAERLEAPLAEHEVKIDGVSRMKGEPPWKIHRFALERCTFQNGILSDDKLHPEDPAWFVDSLLEMALSAGATVADLIEQFCSDRPLQRAEAYRVVGRYHGWFKLDCDPLELAYRDDVEERYQGEC